jgi:hypothetical protein
MDAIGSALMKISQGINDLAAALNSRVAGPGEARASTVGQAPEQTEEWLRRRLGTVLKALQDAGGRMPRHQFYRVSEAAGYRTQGLAGLSTNAANFVAIERDQGGRDTGYRLLTSAGRERLEQLRHLLD